MSIKMSIAALVLMSAWVSASATPGLVGREAEVHAVWERDSFAATIESARALDQALHRTKDQGGAITSADLDGIDRTIDAAESAAAAGNSHDAQALAEKAYARIRSLLTKAVTSVSVSAKPIGEGGAKVEHLTRQQVAEFVTRVEATTSLRDAMKRIAQEKGDSAAAKEGEVIDRLRDRAGEIASRGDLPQARAIIDHAYLRTEVQIERLRRGETLVKALHFATPADEYRYELERNDGYRMLLGVLAPPGSSPALQTSLASHAELAARLRAEAQAAAAHEDYSQAIRLLEDSSKALGNALRLAGLDMPV